MVIFMMTISKNNIIIILNSYCRSYFSSWIFEMIWTILDRSFHSFWFLPVNFWFNRLVWHRVEFEIDNTTWVSPEQKKYTCSVQYFFWAAQNSLLRSIFFSRPEQLSEHWERPLINVPNSSLDKTQITKNQLIHCKHIYSVFASLHYHDC